MVRLPQPRGALRWASCKLWQHLPPCHASGLPCGVRCRLQQFMAMPEEASCLCATLMRGRTGCYLKKGGVLMTNGLSGSRRVV
jgi:hypothetical protein